MRYHRLGVVLLFVPIMSAGTAAASRVTVAPTAPSATTALGQLPPDIMLDSYLLQAEEAVRQRDQATARGAMERITALQEEHALETVPDYHYRYATVWNAVGAWDRSLASAVRYLELTGRDGDHYLDALTLMNRATAAIEEIKRARELRTAEEARARAAAERERVDRERALRAAADAIEQMGFVSIPPGEFRMGSSHDDYSSRYPRTRVRITRGFELARYEVTQSQWEAVMGTNPSLYSECGRCPVDTRSWDDVQRFISLVNTATGGGWTYRLPTEAEWEYAARAGQSGDRLGEDLDASAWFRDNSDRRTRPVGSKRPNAFGLYDMFGNMQELTQDWYTHQYPGGSVTDPTGHVSGSYTYRRRGWGTLTVTPGKVTRGCDVTDSRAQCEYEDRHQFQVPRNRGRSAGLRLARVRP